MFGVYGLEAVLPPQLLLINVTQPTEDGPLGAKDKPAVNAGCNLAWEGICGICAEATDVCIYLTRKSLPSPSLSRISCYWE